MDADQTREHAQDEDDGRRTIETFILIANAMSLVAVVLVLLQPDKNSQLLSSVLPLACTAASWLLLHTSFIPHYARVYYSDPVGGIDFNDPEPPDYLDFAYMAFSTGMTYQVSDTNITQRPMRRAALAHSVVAFTFGMFVLVTSINVVMSLAN